MLWDEPEDFTKPSPEIAKKSRGEGRFIIVRFRNRKDLCDFADKLDLSYLKGMKAGTLQKLRWSVDKEVSDPLSAFMG